MNNMNLRPLTEVELRETEGGSLTLLGLAVGFLVGVIIYAFASSDGECAE